MAEPRVTVPEIEAQYAILMEKIKEYEGDGPGYLAYLFGAAYALKWLLGHVSQAEFTSAANQERGMYKVTRFENEPTF